MIITQQDVDEIVVRARKSELGLGDGLTHKNNHLKLSTYATPHTLDTLAHCLVGGFDEKYDLVSVFSAALTVVAEKAKRNPSPT